MRCRSRDRRSKGDGNKRRVPRKCFTRGDLGKTSKAIEHKDMKKNGIWTKIEGKKGWRPRASRKKGVLFGLFVECEDWAQWQERRRRG